MRFKTNSKLFSSTEIGKKERRGAVGRNKNYRILTFFSVVNVNLLVTQLARLRCQVLVSQSVGLISFPCVLLEHRIKICLCF